MDAVDKIMRNGFSSHCALVFLLTVQKTTGPSPRLWSHRLPISDLQEAIEEDILCGPLSDFPDFKSREEVTLSMTVCSYRGAGCIQALEWSSKF